MVKKKREYIYLNCLDYDGTVFQTQVLDWIHLFADNDVKFDLIQLFQIRQIIHPGFINKQLTGIKRMTKVFKGYLLQFPSRGPFVLLNVIMLCLKLYRKFRRNIEIVIFSRALIGEEIKLLRMISKAEIIFIFDARAASAEEKKYTAVKKHNFTRQKFYSIAHVNYLECQTVLAANKIFAVSDKLKKYYITSCNVMDKIFVKYPCLSDPVKFYFSKELRISVRKELGIPTNTIVFIYSGGISNEWHISEKMFKFFNEMINHSNDVFFLFLSKDKIGMEIALHKFPMLIDKSTFLSVSNIEVCKYLNAADYGILFRENTIMNNVASPTKFAEYMLCGLPVIISEGVGDYSSFTTENGVGLIINERELDYPAEFNFKALWQANFDRIKIAGIGTAEFSKISIVNNLIAHFRE